MSEFKDAAIYLHEMEQARIEADKIKADNDKFIKESAEERYDHLRNDRRKIQQAFSEYKLMVKDVCLAYVIEGMMNPAIDLSTLEPKDQNMVHGLVNNYIKEAGGASAILARIGNKTSLLDTIKEEVEEVSEEIIAKADPQNPETFVVDKEDVEKMMKKLNANDDFDEVKSAIAIRVVGAEDSFLSNAQAEKEKIKEIMLKAEDKCKSVDADTEMSDEVKDDIKQEATRMAQREISRINNMPKKSVFDEMVRLFSQSAVKNNRKEFLLESGHANIDRIYSTVKSMYTLLETIQSSKLERVDEAYIDNALKSI